MTHDKITSRGERLVVTNSENTKLDIAQAVDGRVVQLSTRGRHSSVHHCFPPRLISRVRSLYLRQAERSVYLEAIETCRCDTILPMEGAIIDSAWLQLSSTKTTVRRKQSTSAYLRLPHKIAVTQYISIKYSQDAFKAEHNFGDDFPPLKSICATTAVDTEAY